MSVLLKDILVLVLMILILRDFSLVINLYVLQSIFCFDMITRSKRKALVFCGCNTKSDMIVSLRVFDGEKRHTFLCTPVQALENMLKYQFIWFNDSLE